MKFGKQLVSQMVPEWQDAYMDYNYLKTLLKDIQDFNPRKKPPSSLTRVVSDSYVAFSGLLQRNMTTKRSPHGHGGTADIEDQVILIQNEGSQVGRYETKFQMLSEDGAEYELVFFRRLDDEFNKVDRFYKEKVEEVLKEAALLNKQMDALIAFRIRVKNPEASMDWSVEMTRLRSNVAAASAAIASASVPNSSSKSEGEPHDVIEEPEQSSEEESDESFEEMGSNDTKSFHHCNSIHEEIQRHNSKQSRPAPLQSNSIHEEIQRHNSKQSRPPLLQILEMVKINNTLESPISTIKGILKVDRNKDLEFRKENLGKVEEQLKNAFIQFYQKLRLLKNYSFLNLLAFSKIMKKYDKAASRRASGPYLNMVDSSYLGSSEDVNRLISRVEATFIKHFANSNRREGMSKLRLKPKKERHRTTFSLGLFTGFTLALLISLIMIYQFRNLLRKKGYDQYMQNMYPLYSIFAFIVLHVQMYAANIYFWRKYRVNYTFIFGFKQGTELGYREVSLISTGLATLALASVLANLDMELDERSKDYKAFTELLPLILLSLVVAITFCPFNIIYRSSRYFLLYCVFRCICAPLYKVTLPDFFMADQFTSQIQALRSLEFYICYYGWGDYKHRRNTCKSSDVYNTFYFVVATIPYWSRLLQCLRRLYEEKDPMQGYNALKYFSTVVAVLIRTAYNKQGGNAWWVLAWITSAIATIYSTYWDLIVDWGLLQRKSRNRWLRDKLILTHKSVYFIVMVLNVVLRLAWLQTVLNFQVSFLHKETLNTIVASLEIIRRGIWNFFRLENEHLNNVGKYRAFKSVPLPFNYDEDEDDKDS